MKELHLDFADCSIESSGLPHLSMPLPRTLSRLYLNIAGCRTTALDFRAKPSGANPDSRACGTSDTGATKCINVLTSTCINVVSRMTIWVGFLFDSEVIQSFPSPGKLHPLIEADLTGTGDGA